MFLQFVQKPLFCIALIFSFPDSVEKSTNSKGLTFCLGSRFWLEVDDDGDGEDDADDGPGVEHLSTFSSLALIWESINRWVANNVFSYFASVSSNESIII